MSFVLAALLIMISAADAACAEEATAPFDARRVRWGMSREEVKRSEDSRPVRDDEFGLCYAHLVLGYESLVEYSFDADRLSRLLCSLLSQHANPNDYMVDFVKVKSELSGQYGPPSSDLARWKDKIFKDEAEDWTIAVSSGHLEYEAAWETDAARVTLVLKGADNSFDLSILYSGRTK